MESRIRQLEAELEALRQELRAAHERQRSGDEVFRRFSDSGILGIALFELSGRIVFANGAFLRMIGSDTEEIAAGTVSWDELTPPEWSERAGELLEELTTHGSCAPHESEYLRGDGTRFWGQFTGVLMDSRTAVAFLLDVTERIETERERARLLAREQAARARAEEAQRLHQAVEQKLTVLTEATSALIGSLSLDRVLGEVLALSHRLLTADSYAVWRQDRASGRWTIAAAQGLSMQYRSRVVDLLQHSRRVPDGPMRVSDIAQEPRLSSHRRLLEEEGIRAMLVLPLRLHSTVRGTLVFYYHQPHQWDEIELKVSTALANLAASSIATAELYEAAHQRADQLAEADRLKDQFLAMLAHELRNPLSAISNAIQVTHRAQPGTPAFRRAGEIVERQSQHMARLVDELLDVSRISQGKIELNRQPLDLVDLVYGTAEDHRHVLDAAGLSLEVELPDTPAWVDGDPTRLRQALGNVLQNAAKFTDPGGHVTVRVGLISSRGANGGRGGREADGDPSPVPHPEIGAARVEVSDTGIGIAPELLPRLFEPFVQADTSLDRTRGGLGLGLALVKKITELHGGRVEIRSEGLGRGATLAFEIPVQSSLVPGEAPFSAAGERAEPLRILIIEDNPDAAETLRDLLEILGHRAEIAPTGPTGVEMARRLRPDIVLCDLGLPGMSGYAVAAALRQDPATVSLRLIAVSGYGQEEDIRRSTEAGFEAHLTKPVEPGLLERILAGSAGR